MSIRHAALELARAPGLNGALRSVARRWPFLVPAQIAGGGRMWVDLRSGMGQGIFLKGEFDPAAIQPALDALPSGGVFLDVGANIGFYSVLAARKAGQDGRVYAFEMDARPLRCLRKTIRAERLDTIRIIETAVTDRNGVTFFEESAEPALNRIGGATERARRTRSICLDGWAEEVGLRRLDVIKIDVEGAEQLVLEGARRIIARFMPVIVCEVGDLSREFGHSPEGVVALLEEAGYKTSWLSGVWSPTLLAQPRRSPADA